MIEENICKIQFKAHGHYESRSCHLVWMWPWPDFMVPRATCHVRYFWFIYKWVNNLVEHNLLVKCLIQHNLWVLCQIELAPIRRGSLAAAAAEGLLTKAARESLWQMQPERAAVGDVDATMELTWLPQCHPHHQSPGRYHSWQNKKKNDATWRRLICAC